METTVKLTRAGRGESARMKTRARVLSEFPSLHAGKKKSPTWPQEWGGGNSSRSHAVWKNVATWSPELLLIGPIRGETDGTPETGQNAPWVSRRRSPSDAEVGPVFILWNKSHWGSGIRHCVKIIRLNEVSPSCIRWPLLPFSQMCCYIFGP